MKKKKRNLLELIAVLLVFAVLIILTFLINVYVKGTGIIGVYGLVLFIYLLLKMGLSFCYKPIESPVGNYKVVAVVPSYNEEGSGLLDTLESLINQTYPLDKIYIVDDGSSDLTGYNQVKAYLDQHPELDNQVVLHYAEQNAGKRHAQAWAFKRSDADIFLTVDSDSIVAPDALEELLKAFSHDDIYAVTGHINAKNIDDNVLTRLIDIRYDNAFRVERAAQSATGNIIVCSGPLSAYRREVIIPNLDRYLNQTFLGVKVNIGDDRCLTNYALEKGRTVYQSTAKCATAVPSKLSVFIKQQIRWNKSFFREALQTMKLLFKRPIVTLWNLFELFLFVLLTGSLIDVVFNITSKYDLKYFLYAMIAISLSALARNVHYIVKHPLLFLMAPLYGFMHLFLLVPIRLYALLTIRNVRWGTRVHKGDGENV
ncbi:TPA: glycosyltransferase [Streptococcus suis]